MINHVTYHLKMHNFPEFHAFSKIAPGIEHLAFSTRENVNTRTSTSLGQEISHWESDRGTPPPKTGGWQQPLSQSSCLASCHASCETNKSWTAGSKCLKTGKYSRQHGKKKMLTSIERTISNNWPRSFHASRSAFTRHVHGRQSCAIDIVTNV